eukprot:CAMPEP_0117670974 /NCGR_PEP_ID=MMETSP0804-20121206/13071_1 /TAXON_ID=1074897 /ORGANISM="Tetraselmis astigmatica, Strain CCMP880" /LENGTH=405 /DNA_ID=CAMNT_0005479373 /DNA_START=205 /DNA_END=1419 /DNA_ORIENTATION=+
MGFLAWSSGQVGSRVERPAGIWAAVLLQALAWLWLSPSSHTALAAANRGANCSWNATPLNLPASSATLNVRLVTRQQLTAGAANMRGQQIARVLNSHPNVSAALVRAKDCRSYCAKKESKGVTHVIFVKYPCPGCRRHRGLFQALDLVDNVGFLHGAKGSLPPGYTYPGTYSALIVNTQAMATTARSKGHTTVVIDHQHNNFCDATAIFRKKAAASHPFQVYFIGGNAKAMDKQFRQAEQELLDEFPHLRLDGLQIRGATLGDDFQRLAAADVAVVWDQCTEARFSTAKCFAYKPNTRAAAAMSAGLPVLMHGRYSGHRELAADFGGVATTASQRAALLPETWPQLVAGLRLLLRDPGLREALGKRSKQVSQRYGIREVGGRFLQVLLGQLPPPTGPSATRARQG